MSEKVDNILKRVATGDMSVEEATKALKLEGIKHVRDFAVIDTGRLQRTGIMEIILAEGKNSDEVVETAIALAEEHGFALISRVSQPGEIITQLRNRGFSVEHNERARMILVKNAGYEFTRYGRIGLIAAGTADIPVAEEARMVAEACGCEVLKAYDVGVAGIHRLMEPLEEFINADVAVIIVVAGMDGALPSVVASLVDVPVIGVPTSVGYGLGGKGVAALLSMLQSCSPGLAVVNIDNGVGAAAIAAKCCRYMPHHDQEPGEAGNDGMRNNELETKLGYTFRDRRLLDRALTRKAYALEQRHRVCEDQEVFRTLGDAVLKLILVDLLMRRGCKTREELTVKKMELERKETLAEIGRKLSIGQFILLGRGEKKQSANEEPYVLAETLEAVIGAIFLDAGYEHTREVVARWFEL